jgi:hypothetical protein
MIRSILASSLILLLVGAIALAGPANMAGSGGRNTNKPPDKYTHVGDGRQDHKKPNATHDPNTVIPEPTTLALLGLGAFGLGLYRSAVRKNN